MSSGEGKPSGHRVCGLGRHGSELTWISRTELGFLIDSRPQASAVDRLAECVATLLRERPELQLSPSSFLEVELRPDHESLRGDVLRGICGGSPDLALTATMADVREPLASVNGQDHVAVAFDEGTFELEPRRDESYLSFFDPIAEIREEENGLNVRAVGRLADGHIVYVDHIDGSEGSVVAARKPTSDVVAVQNWLERIDGNPFDYIGMVTYVFRDGGTIRTLADFDTEPESMAMTFTIKLTTDEFESLWSGLPT